MQQQEGTWNDRKSHLVVTAAIAGLQDRPISHFHSSQQKAATTNPTVTSDNMYLMPPECWACGTVVNGTKFLALKG
jgi:hypothetical protein